MASDHHATRLGIVVGLAAEARIARRLGNVEIGGGGAAGAEAAAARLIARGVDALLSFGLCGGLDPTLLPGALLVPHLVLDGGFRHAASPELSARFGGPTSHVLLGARAVVANVAGKRRLRDTTGADAVDLESGAVARAAIQAGLPFAVLRAVCDPAGSDLPPAALAALDRHGTIGLARVLLSLASRPSQLAALMALARHAGAARRSLVVAVARAVRTSPTV